MTKTERDLALDSALDNYIELARWAHARFGRAEANAKCILVAMAFNDDSYIQWAKLALYCLTELHWIEQERMLTPTERQLRSIAERIYDACVATARRQRQDLQLPRDEARRQLDAAYTRALFELRPPEKGEPS